MRAFKYYEGAIDRFKNEGVVLKSEGGRLGILYELDAEEQKLVREAEESVGIKIYAAIKGTYLLGGVEKMSFLTCLYVSKYYSEWRQDRADLITPADDKGNFAVMAYVINLQEHTYSEMGSVYIAHTAAGGYQRTA